MCIVIYTCHSNKIFCIVLYCIVLYTILGVMLAVALTVCIAMGISLWLVLKLHFGRTVFTI